MLRKLFVVFIASTLFVGCGTGTDQQNDNTPGQTPTDENLNNEEMDDNLNREQIEQDVDEMIPEEEIVPNENNNE